MKKTISNLFKISLSIVLLYGCNLSSPEEIVDISETSNVLSIPAGFDFSTHQKVTINIVENAAYAKYDVYAYSDVSVKTPTESELAGKLVFSGVPSNGVLKQTISLPTYYTKVYIRRNENQNISVTAKDILNQEVNFNSTEAKSTTQTTSSKSSANIDSDGDGVLDQYDAYPNDPEKAFNLFTPSIEGSGILAFEDLWPSTGDYDFNDVALRYQSVVYLNANGFAVGFDFKYQIISNRAGSYNGIGFEIEGIAPSQIESVTEPILTIDFIKLNPNGTEAGQENAVIILTDAIRNTRVGADFILRTVSVKFVDPISTSDLGVAPFNPFLISNLYSNTQVFEKVRDHEVHLPNMKPTSLGVSLRGKEDPDGRYISQSGYPWALSIIEYSVSIEDVMLREADTTNANEKTYFTVPKDTTSITRAYNFFKTWAESGGSEYKNWYTNGSGFRNESLLQ
ncbi:MAG: LruC domain-containing protein [Polaribacter sp.]|nr:LruC domain-containing protein [Polaribacter sp.]